MKERIIKYFGVFLFILILVNLGFLNWYFFREKLHRSQSLGIPVTQKESYLSDDLEEEAKAGECSVGCWVSLEEKINEKLATFSAETIVSEKQTLSPAPTQAESSSGAKIIYIPLGAGGSTTNRDWTSILGAEVYLDLASYSGVKEITWEAFIKVQDGNGPVYARLYDATHLVPILESEVSANSQDFIRKNSSPLSLFSGDNLYQVQLKSQTGYEGTIGSSRIKIVLE